jgi:hypothetical protein
MFGDRLLVPVEQQAHDLSGIARAAFRSFAFGAGGFSSNSITRRLSRFVSLTRSCSSMTDCGTDQRNDRHAPQQDGQTGKSKLLARGCLRILVQSLRANASPLIKEPTA